MGLNVDDVTDAVEIGRGAFGVVYRAHQESFDRTVAVKVLANVDVDEASLERFAREVRAVGRLSGHPNIVAVYTHGTTDSGAPYMLMEFCQSGSYGDAVRNGRRLSWQEATEVAISIAGALETSHRSGILHRDVKPDNILIDGYGVPKLADFGIARQSTQSSMTATGMLTGSPAHVAPEIVAGEVPSAASDIYSLGSTVHALITGEPAFVRTTDSSILPLLQRIATASPPSLQQWGVPAPIADVVLATMSKDPTARPATALAFAEDLQRARQASGAPPAPFRVLADPSSPAPDADATVLPAPGVAGATPTPYGLAAGVGAVGATAAAPPAAPTMSSGDATMVTSSGPPVPSTPAGPPTSAPPPGSPGSDAGRKRRGPLIAWIVGGAAALVLAVGGIVAAIALSGGPGPEVAQTSSPPEVSGEPDPPPEPGITDEEAAEALLLTAGQVADLTFSDWDEDSGGAGINANAGFCSVQLSRGPELFLQNSFYLSIDGPGTLPQVVSAGGVFDTAEDAAQYMADRSDSAACGSWNQNGSALTVFELPIAPLLVGCECQVVSAHEVVASNPDGSAISQFTILSQEDRYVSAVFYALPAEFAGLSETVDLVGALIDLSVQQVSDVAQSAAANG